MKKQVVFIHGGEVYNSYEAYIDDLKTFTVDPYNQKKRWRTNLQETLGEAYEVFTPEMPNKYNAKYSEWKIWFEKYFPYIKDEVIVIGHSLGAAFLLKYFSEESFPVSVRALYLIAAPYFTVTQEEGADFRFTGAAVSSITSREIILAHSLDDQIVPFDDMQQLKRLLPTARTMEFTDYGHFLHESFPELIEDIKRLS